MLYSNDPVSEEDVPALQKLVLEAQEETKSLRQELILREEEFQRFKKHFQYRIHRLQELQSATSLIRKLTPEILAKIFVETITDRIVRDVWQRSEQIKTSPWNIGQVCSQWRSITRAVPQIWSRLRVSSFHTSLPFIRDVLENCGGKSPVEIDIYLRDRDWVIFRDLVAEKPQRLQSLTIQQPHLKTGTTLEASPGAFDELRFLSLSFVYESHLGRYTPRYRTGISPNEFFNSVFSTTPNLRKVVLSFLSYQNFMDPSGSMLPWDCLTDITISGVYGRAALVTLSLCQKLINLKISLPSFESDDPPISNMSFGTISFPHLSSISTAGQIDHIIDLLSLVTHVPSLKILVLEECTDYSGRIPVPPGSTMQGSCIIELIRRSGCRLDQFRATGMKISLIDFLPMLRAMPTLKWWGASTDKPITEEIFSIITKEEIFPDRLETGFKRRTKS